VAVTVRKSIQHRISNAANAACPDHPDRLVPPESQADQASPEHQVNLVHPESHHLLPANRSHLRHASHARKVLPVPLDHPVHPAIQEMLALPDDQEPTHLPEDPEHEVHPARPANLDQLDRPVSLEFPLKANLLRPESPENKEMSDHPDHPAFPAPQVTTDLLDRLAPRVHPDQTDLRERTVSPDHLDHLARLVDLERRVSAPSTAPSTAASSSKTALDAKLPLSTYSIGPFSFNSFNSILFFLAIILCNTEYGASLQRS